MVVHVGGADGETQVADADVVGVGGEEFVKESGAGFGIHVLDQLCAAAGESKAEAVDCLIGFRRIDVDDLIGCCSFGEGDWRCLELKEGGAVWVGQPERDIVLGVG